MISYAAVMLTFCHFVDSLCSLHGAPSTACRSLFPAHGYSEQTSRPPYRIFIDKGQIFSNETLTVTLAVNSGKYRFKGFIIQGKSTPYWQRPHQPAVGTFHRTEVIRLLSCFNDEKNTATHVNGQSTKQVDMVWQPPHDFNGSVTFRATVVASFKTFWTNLASDPVNIQKAG